MSDHLEQHATLLRLLHDNAGLRRENREMRGSVLFWRVLAAVASLVALGNIALGQSPETYATAQRDRAQFAVADWPYTYYVSTDHLPVAQVLTAGRTAAFVISSFSRAVVLEHHLPVEVTRGLWRIDLRGLEWDTHDWARVVSRYPYWPPGKPLVVRADWLVVQLADEVESDAGPTLLYGAKAVPQNKGDFLKFWKVGAGGRDPLLLAWVEEESGVSLLKTRRIENRTIGNRGYAWGTEDLERRNFNPNTNPIEGLLVNRKHDAEEWIIGFPKLSVDQGVGGTAQAYALFNGAGQRQTAAPVRIVEDHGRTRGYAEIRNSASCITCHARGINPVTRNKLRDLIASGVDYFENRRDQQLIEAQYLADVRLQTEISRNQQDYSVFVAMVTGWGPEENVRAFRELVDTYDRPLALEDASRELGMASEEFRLALAYKSNAQKVGSELASLAHGGHVERAYFETVYRLAFEAAATWRQVQK